ncbi:MAG TPA: outer membrane beta-barrel protein [Gemmatimonadaceae bacterium]
MIRMRLTVMLALIALVTFAANASAQRVSRTKGFHIALGLNASAIQLDEDDVGEDTDAENGGGLYLTTGYNFTPRIGAFLALTGARIDAENVGDDYNLGHADLGARFMLATGSIAPYLELALTGLNARGEDDQGRDIELRGGGLTLGIGSNFFVSQRFAIDLGLRLTGGEFNTVKFGDISISNDDGVGVGTARLNLGVAFYPSAGRR